MTFLVAHAELDRGHSKAAIKAIEAHVKSEKDKEAVTYFAKATFECTTTSSKAYSRSSSGSRRSLLHSRQEAPRRPPRGERSSRACSPRRPAQPLKVRPRPDRRASGSRCARLRESAVYNCPLTLECMGSRTGGSGTAALDALASRTKRCARLSSRRRASFSRLWRPKGCCASNGRSAGARGGSRTTFARAPFDSIHAVPSTGPALITVSPDECSSFSMPTTSCRTGGPRASSFASCSSSIAGSCQENAVLLPPCPGVRGLRPMAAKAGARPRHPRAYSEALEDVAPLRLPTGFRPAGASHLSGARVPLRIPAAAARASPGAEGASLYPGGPRGISNGGLALVPAGALRGRNAGAQPQSRRSGRGGRLLRFSTVPIPADFPSSPRCPRPSRASGRAPSRRWPKEDVPFEDLVAFSRGSKRARGVPPLVQALFVWQEALMPDLDLGEARVRRARKRRGRASSISLCRFGPRATPLRGTWSSTPDLFHTATVEWMIDRLAPMLAAMHRTPSERLDSLSLGDGAPVELGLGTGPARFGHTAESYARTVPPIRCRARGRYDGEAADFRGARPAASALAATVARPRAPRRASPWRSCFRPALEAVVAVVAAWKRRSPYVPLDPSWPVARIEGILREIGASVLLRDSDFGSGRSFSIREAERTSSEPRLR